jgi:hypothetical protein
MNYEMERVLFSMLNFPYDSEPLLMNSENIFDLGEAKIVSQR